MEFPLFSNGASDGAVGVEEGSEQPASPVQAVLFNLYFYHFFF